MNMIGDSGITWVWAIVVAPFVGSFLGVLVLRLPEGRPVGFTRSACPHCGHRLAARDLVPFLSWLLSSGRCRYCAAPLGLFYPVIEAAALAVALWAAAVLPGMLIWAGCLLGWSLLGAAVIDWRHTVLPDVLVLPLIPAGIGFQALLGSPAWSDHAIGALLGFASFATVTLLYRQVRGREGLGWGDAKLLAAAGAWVSWAGLPSVVLLAALFGLAGAAVRRMAGHELVATTEIPFGPALALAIWLVWLYGPVVPS